MHDPEDGMPLNSTMQPIGSAISTSLREMTAQVGRPPGEPGSGTMLVSVPEALTAAMAGADPKATDQSLVAGLPPSLARSLTKDYRTWIDPQYGYDCEFRGWVVERNNVAPGEMGIGRSMVAAAMAPLGGRDLKMELARLASVTIPRNSAETDEALRGMAFAEILSEYPADIARAALRGWSKKNKFWPTESELLGVIEPLLIERKALEKALR